MFRSCALNSITVDRRYADGICNRRSLSFILRPVRRKMILVISGVTFGKLNMENFVRCIRFLLIGTLYLQCSMFSNYKKHIANGG